MGLAAAVDSAAVHYYLHVLDKFRNYIVNIGKVHGVLRVLYRYGQPSCNVMTERRDSGIIIRP